jgi:NAD/NADP transhydrogenase alpha subunit
MDTTFDKLVKVFQLVLGFAGLIILTGAAIGGAIFAMTFVILAAQMFLGVLL